LKEHNPSTNWTSAPHQIFDERLPGKKFTLLYRATRCELDSSLFTFPFSFSLFLPLPLPLSLSISLFSFFSLALFPSFLFSFYYFYSICNICTLLRHMNLGMDSRHKIFTNFVTTKEPHSASFIPILAIISLVVILLSLGTVQAHTKYTQIPSSSHSPILTTSLQPSTHLIKQQLTAGQFTVMQIMDHYLAEMEMILQCIVTATKIRPSP
jgi:hypothetical protein